MVALLFACADYTFRNNGINNDGSENGLHALKISYLDLATGTIGEECGCGVSNKQVENKLWKLLRVALSEVVRSGHDLLKAAQVQRWVEDVPLAIAIWSAGLLGVS
jgi:hypothetical protein